MNINCLWNFYFYFFDFLESFNLWHTLLMIVFYHQTKTSIDFCCLLYVWRRPNFSVQFSVFCSLIRSFLQRGMGLNGALENLVNIYPMGWKTLISQSCVNSVTLETLVNFIRLWIELSIMGDFDSGRLYC